MSHAMLLHRIAARAVVGASGACRTLRVAAVQLSVTDVPEDNIKRARHLIDTAADDGATVVALPECFVGSYGVEHFPRWQEPLGGEPLRGGAAMMARAARDRGIFVSGGVIEAGAKPGFTLMHPAPHLFNAVPVFGPDGQLVVNYRKVHLSRVLGITSEGDVLEPGDAPVAWEAPGCGGEPGAFRFGMACCYDLRFPALLARYGPGGARPADVLLAPSAFLDVTGVDHWDLLLRRAALDGQCYVVAPNVARRAGVDATPLHGRSAIIDPWGAVVAQCAAEGVDLAVADVRRERIQEVRAKLPLVACARDVKKNK